MNCLALLCSTILALSTTVSAGADVPPPGQLMDGEVAWRQHEKGHTADPNWPYFLDFAARYLHNE